jgi:hypothetical protein
MGAESGLKDAERAFQGWRRSRRTSCGRIPEELWAKAASVARVHGVTKTAERLRLNGTRLKERCELEAEGRGFVELAASELPLAGEFVVELENADGVRLRLLLRGAPVEVVITAAKELWSASR